MRHFILAMMVSASAVAANAQTMGPHNGPICPGLGSVYIKPTPACGATTLHGGFFKLGRFQRMYQSTATACIPKEVFLGCQ